MLGVDLGWSVCVSDGIQHNIIHNTVFARMIIKMAWDDGSYVVTQCVCYADAHQPPLHSINCQN